MNLNQVKKIYMIGIKGVGMTMLAQFLNFRGIEVFGSDVKEKFMTDEVLRENKIKVIKGFDKKNIPKDADLIIYSTAYNSKTNQEVAEVLKENYKVLTYAEALAKIFNQYYGIAVIGSHGKTTTTAWLGYVLEKSGVKPNVLVGSSVPQFGGSALVGQSDYLLVEMDEYQNKLKYFEPKIVVLNNIEYDHPDFFPDEESYAQVFIDFIKKIPKDGLLIVNFDDPIIKKIAEVNCKGRVVSYGMDNLSDYMAYDFIQKDRQNFFKVKFGFNDEEDANPEDSFLGSFVSSLIGRHNVYNALAVISLSIEMGLKLSDIRTYLDEFQGTSRRMEIMGKFKGSLIIDDYAHHPTEVKTTLDAISKNYPDKKIVTVFHPHTFTRTKALLKDFSLSFKKSSKVIVLDIYGSAREEQGGVHSRDLVALIKEDNKRIKAQNQVLYIPGLAECEKYLRENIKSDEIIVLMGAGDVFRIGENLIKK